MRVFRPEPWDELGNERLQSGANAVVKVHGGFPILRSADHTDADPNLRTIVG